MRTNLIIVYGNLLFSLIKEIYSGARSSLLSSKDSGAPVSLSGVGVLLYQFFLHSVYSSAKELLRSL